MERRKVDLLVIGSGPSGQKAAIQAAKLGKSVIITERKSKPGGACLHSGTIPSKSLREAIIDLTRFHQRSFYGVDYEPPQVTIKELSGWLERVVSDQMSILHRQFKKNGVELVQGLARFENENTVLVIDNEDRIVCEIEAGNIIIAAGSKPRNPVEVEFDHEVIVDSTSLLSLNHVPKTMLVLGGGVIGSEYATFFAALGTEVTVIDQREHMLPLIDAEIGTHLQTALANIGLTFLPNKKPTKITKEGNQAIVEFEDGSQLQSDCLLYALGRQANVKDLHIDNVGIETDNKGYIIVNSLFQTSVPSIYAVGDVIGGPCLASTSMEQGRLAAKHACGSKIPAFPALYPFGIYTIPEISYCGYTEEELQKMGFRYEIGRAYYYELARSHITGTNTGLFKILFHADTLEILGVHIIGRSASENIHIAQVAMTFRADLNYFVNHVFNYPTYAEGYRVAALNGLNKVKKVNRKYQW